MSHLTPGRTAHITPGGSAVPRAQSGAGAEPDTSWDGLIADLAAALGLEADAAVDFTSKVDDVVQAVAGYGDPEVARTHVRAALLGNTGMLDGLTDLDLSPRRVDDLLATWDQGPGGEGDRIVARLALMHTDLVEPASDPAPGTDDPVGEGEGGSADPLPETAVTEFTDTSDSSGEPWPEPDVHVGQVAYTLDSVPSNAKACIAWIGEADTGDDRRARAQAALEVEDQRTDRRSSVDKAIGAVLDG